ncbi:alcohol dehydrogenase catalytic domain-containing protein [Microbacterium gorillae]|uniref:alcohol dehydrogenase catalytic domain-containing protein n=1 Tax=Microbacterium gorillae TaxID=1231063 RepID=UPI000693F1F5|nr:alcohol dehydrogenase catalytic domain-containing protein [Microbacterium gorillae]
MRAAQLIAPGEVALVEVPDPRIEASTDAVVRVVAAAVCGSDLHDFRDGPRVQPAPMGHEFIGVVEDIGTDVATLRRGDFVIAPFAISDGTCDFCREGLHVACRNGGYWGDPAFGGGQAEAVRVPYADGTLVRVPATIAPDDHRALLTLADVFCTGWYGVREAGVGPGDRVVIIGDGAVGLLAVHSAKLRGAEEIVLMGSHEDRIAIGERFGATTVVRARGAEGIAQVREASGGDGYPAVVDAVGFRSAYEQAVGVVRPGGVISRVGVPQNEEAPVGYGSLFGLNARLVGGTAPVRAVIDELLALVLDGRADPGCVIDAEFGLDEVAEAYTAMATRTVIKALLRPDGSRAARRLSKEVSGQ